MPNVTPGRAFLARLARFGVVLGMILLALIAGLVVLQVAARNFFDAGLPWADELARFSCIALVFFAVPCLAGRQVLVSVSMLPDMVRPALRRWLVLIADLATLGFAALMIWSFAEFLPRAGKFLTPAMRVPNWVYYSLALAGCLLLAVIAALRVLDALRQRDPTAPYRDARDADGLPL
ncbi:C4-dicarboxylate ABC transporter substrate-binding protein [Sulfitobacter sp. EhC04]|uniref:TRAP transporter small permease n=1 Tax=Sulfitobacter sp. EhC04 TaxID=1849168 RepID=UPI0007F4B6EE|nr:TRAP transporter small permease subunit [Sulfitobacter sp. EhC04]OAN75644.1 C4-dicarboxylate ABC transporter substrate-binding protein [Sulfitobacter sp. EhC04]